MKFIQQRNWRLFAAIFIFSTGHGWPQQESSLKIPKWGLPLTVKGTVCGTPGDIVIDTGSRFSTVNEEFANYLTPLTSRNVLDGDGTVRQVGLFQGATISFGQELANGPVYTGDLSASRIVVGRRILALLGATALADKQILIRQSLGQLSISEQPMKGWSELTKDGMAFPMESLGDTPHIEISFGSGLTGKALIDSGNDKAMTLHQPIFDRLAKEKRISLKGTTRIATASGFAEVPHGRLDRFEFCGVVFEDLAVSPMPASSTIGLKVLSRFIWGIDFPNRRAYFLPDPDYQAPFDLQHHFGALLGYLPDGNARIFQIEGNSPVAIAGLKEGDIVTDLGTIRTGSFSKEAVLEFLMANTGKEIHLKYLREGNRLEVGIQIP